MPTNRSIQYVIDLFNSTSTITKQYFTSKSTRYIPHRCSPTNHPIWNFYARYFISILITAAVIGNTAVCIAYADDNPKPDTASEQIKLTNSFRVMSPHGELNVVQVQYEFPDKKYVLVSSHGLVSGKGTLRFLTKADQIEFRDPSSNTLLAAVKNNNDMKLMGRKVTRIPLEPDFPPTSRTARWNQSQPFADNLINVLNRHFPNGYLPIDSETGRVFITNYKEFGSTLSFNAFSPSRIKVQRS